MTSHIYSSMMNNRKLNSINTSALVNAARTSLNPMPSKGTGVNSRDARIATNDRRRGLDRRGTNNY